VIAAMPWLDVDAILSRLSTLRRRCSSGLVMPSSISSALAPVQTTRTVTISSSNVGKNCTLSRSRAKAPASSMMTISRFAATLW